MGYGIFWLTHLGYSLLLVTTITALAVRCKKPRWQRFWPILTAMLLFYPFVLPIRTGGYLLMQNLQPKWLFWYGLSDTIAYIIGVVMIIKIGLKDGRSKAQPARHWPRLRLAAAFVIFLFLHFFNLANMNMEIRSDLFEVQRDTTQKLVDLLPSHIPQDGNAHPVYEQAAKALDTPDDLPEWLSESDKPDFEPSSEKVTNLLAKHQGALSMVRRAASMPGYSPEIDVENYWESSIPEYSHYLIFSRLLNLSARSKALTGDTAGSIKELAVMESMARHLRNFPLLISFMVAIAVDQIRMQGLEYVLCHTPNPPADLIPLPVTAHPSVLNSYLNTQRFEAQGRLQFFTFFTLIDDISSMHYAPEDLRKNRIISTRSWRVFALPTELKIEREIFVYWMSKPVENYEALYKNLEKINDAREAGEIGLFAAIDMPNFVPYMVRTMWRDVLMGLCDLALASTAYKGANGRYPAKLEDLVPDFIDRIPPDPFDGKPLKMKPVEGGMMLYSVGRHPKIATLRIENPVHFYLGREAYEKYRVTPVKEKRLKEAQRKK